jgi:hypothetical protein
MKSLLIVTHVDFWRKGAGHRSRLSSLIEYLKSYVTITVVYAGTFNERDSMIMRRDYAGIELVPLEPHRTISFKEHGKLFQAFISNKTFDVALIEYIEMSFVLPMLDENTFTILDTHDLVADRIRSFIDNEVPYGGIMMSEQEEIGIFQCFDKVLLIQASDYIKIGGHIGFDKALLVPHAAILPRRDLRDVVKNIGYVGSEYIPNVKATTWFLSEVWPSIGHSNEITLNIYGNVVRRLSPELMDNCEHARFHGFVDDINAIYDHCDIMINPVKVGAGLKIKNMEAMACGLPLVTTSHGAVGIDEGMNECFLVADTPTEFTTAVHKLIASAQLRNDLGSKAYSFVEKKFSPASCYDELLNCMHQSQVTE